MTTSRLYDTDYYAWTVEQAQYLRAGRGDHVDWLHLAEEIEDMGRTQKRELASRLKILFAHLLKWQYQPSHRGHSWRYTVEEQRNELFDHLSDNPSLKSTLPEAITRGYRNAIVMATRETGLAKDTFPQTCPWTIEQALDQDFWPE